jgi:hypothetical protein
VSGATGDTRRREGECVKEEDEGKRMSTRRRGKRRGRRKGGGRGGTGEDCTEGSTHLIRRAQMPAD